MYALVCVDDLLAVGAITGYAEFRKILGALLGEGHRQFEQRWIEAGLPRMDSNTSWR